MPEEPGGHGEERAGASQGGGRHKVPRYTAYATELPKTPSGKIAKSTLRRPETDLRAGSFDRVENRWR